MEEWLVETIVEMIWYLVHPDQAFGVVDIKETEPVVLLKAGSWSYTQLVVWVHGGAVASEDQHASET